MENNISIEKINLVLELLKNLSEEEWKLIKKYIDDNFEKINEMNLYQLKSKNKFIQIEKELLQLN